MTPEDNIQTCCIANCTNTESNSSVDFFSFPEPRYRSFQRNKWIMAIRNNNSNDPCWLPDHNSVVCSTHFVKGHPGSRSQDVDYVPSLFGGAKKTEIKSRAVSVKKFALEYIKHDALLEKRSRFNFSSDLRKCAYVKLAAALGIPVVTARTWERRFRDYFEQKMASSPDKSKPPAGSPHWLFVVAKRLGANPMHCLSAPGGRAATPAGVVLALATAARARATLCSTAMYNDVRRALRISVAINDLHAVWVSAQRVSLEAVGAAGRAGDAAPAPPAHAAQVADLVLLHSDVDMHRLVTDESVTAYEESAALHTLWQLVQRHRLEDTGPMEPRERARRWTQAHRDYLDSGRFASLVVLQRRWHELKLQARVRLAAHWRRAALPPRAPAIPAPRTPAFPAPRAPPAPPAPAATPHLSYPRPAPIHISILKRYPHIATGAFKSWRQLVLDGAVVIEPLDPDSNVKETQEEDNAQSHEPTDPQLDPKVGQPTVVESEMEETWDGDHKAKKTTVNESKIKKVSNEHSSLNDPLAEQTSNPTVDEPFEKTKVNKPLVKQSTTGDPFARQLDAPMDTDVLYEEANTEDRIAVKSTVNEHRVDQSDPSADNPLVDKTVVETTDCDILGRQSTSNDRMAVQPTVNGVKVEQTMGSDHSADKPLAEKTTVNNLLAELPSLIKRIGSNQLNEQGIKDQCLPVMASANDIKVEIGSSTENALFVDLNEVAEKSTGSELLTKRAVSEQQMDYALLYKSSTRDELLDRSTVDYASNAVSASLAHSLGRAGTSSEQILRADDQLSEVIPRYYPTQSNSSDTDTDVEDNLVIDEFSNNTPCSPNQEQIAHTDTHSVDAAPSLENTAPTIAVLQMIDPSTVKTEILFESDEEDFQPYIEQDKIEVELDTKENVSFIADKIKFADDEPGARCDVKIEHDVTERMDREDAQESDEHDNDNIDPKLLMDTKVLLFRIDKTRAWKNNVRKDKSIKFSRIHRRFYTPNPKKYYITPKSKTKRDSSGRFTVKPRNIVSTAKANSNTLETNYNIKKQEMEVHSSLLNKVADTRSARQLSRNIKRESIEGEHDTPNKRVKTTSDTDDDQPLLVVREKKYRQYTETADGLSETADDVSERIEASSSDEELVNGEVFLNKFWEVKRKAGGRSAASTIEWSAELEAGAPRAKRVSLPDREQLRRGRAGPRVAQVAPITLAATETQQDSGLVEPPGDDAADEDTPLAWRALDLPADDQLDAALDELTSASNVEHVLQSSPCCAARRHRDVNDARRRIGIAELPLHTHADGVCTCCCAHLSDGDVRARLDQQVRALHNDIERMLWKNAVGRSHSKPLQKHSRSPSPASTTTTPKPSTKDLPASVPTEAKSSKTKPATYTNRSKQRRTKPRSTTAASAPAEPAAPAVDYYEEWQRQKTMNAQYFHINSSFKNKKTTPQTAAQSTARQSVPQNVTSPSGTQTVTSPSGTQTVTPQSVTQTATRPSVITHSAVANSMAPTQTSQGGLMPYIRESRLIAPVDTRSMTCIEVPTLLPVIYPRGTPARLIPQKPPKCAKPARVVPAQTVPVSKLQRTTPRPIAPKPDSMQRAPEVLNTAKEEPVATAKPTNVTTEQVPEPQTSTSQPVDKPLSILEEYSRTLSIETPRDKPLVNALSLRVPDGPTGPKTTIVMTLTIPSETVIKQTINCLYANETVDLTTETEAPSVKTTEAQKIPPVGAIVAAVKSLINTGNSVRSLLKPSNTNASGSVLKSHLDSPRITSKLRTRAPRLMSLSNNLHDGDIIEIEDTDSSDESNDSHSGSAITINKSSTPAVYCNKSSKSAGTSRIKRATQSTSNTDVLSSQMAASDTNGSIQNTNGANNISNKASKANINEKSQKAASELDELKNPAPTTNLSKSVNETKYSNLKKLRQTTGDTNNSNLAVGKTNESKSQGNKTKTSNQSVSKATTSNQYVSKATTSNQSVSKATTSNQSVDKATTSNQSDSKTTTSNQSVDKATTSNQSVSKATTSNQSVDKATTSNQSVDKATTSNQSDSKTTTSNQSVDKATTSNQFVSKTTTSNQSVDKATTSNLSVSKKTTSNQSVSKTTTSNQSVDKATTSNLSVSKTTTSNQSVDKATTSHQATNINQVPKLTTSNMSRRFRLISNKATPNLPKGTTSDQATGSKSKIKRRTKPTTSNRSPRKTYPSLHSDLSSWYKLARDRIKDKLKKPSWLKEEQHQETSAVEAVQLANVAHVQAVQSLSDGSARCPGRCANVAAMPDFMDKLRAAAANVSKEVYTHKSAATEVAASGLACGETLLCVDASRPPLGLAGGAARGERHLVLTDAHLPCAMPTYWTLASFNRMARVVPEQVTGDGLDGADRADGADGADRVKAAVVASGAGGARWCADKGEWVMHKDDKKICDQNHNFKILTAFCSAEGVRQAARAGATLYLLHVQRARVLVLSMTRVLAGGDVRHRARADAKPDLLRELEVLLDEAEIEEKQRAPADVTDAERTAEGTDMVTIC